uniref:VP4 n=1 Tax=kestrel polyomavirus 1 TaxID=3074466 RepID=A0AA51VIN7_9POLY|nr:putative VP4 [kestrel polyomavirus 1]
MERDSDRDRGASPRASPQADRRSDPNNGDENKENRPPSVSTIYWESFGDLLLYLLDNPNIARKPRTPPVAGQHPPLPGKPKRRPTPHPVHHGHRREPSVIVTVPLQQDPPRTPMERRKLTFQP